MTTGREQLSFSSCPDNAVLVRRVAAVSFYCDQRQVERAPPPAVARSSGTMPLIARRQQSHLAVQRCCRALRVEVFRAAYRESERQMERNLKVYYAQAVPARSSEETRPSRFKENTLFIPGCDGEVTHSGGIQFTEAVKRRRSITKRRRVGSVQSRSTVSSHGRRHTHTSKNVYPGKTFYKTFYKHPAIQAFWVISRFLT